MWTAFASSLTIQNTDVSPYGWAVQPFNNCLAIRAKLRCWASVRIRPILKKTSEIYWPCLYSSFLMKAFENLISNDILTDVQIHGTMQSVHKPSIYALEAASSAFHSVGSFLNGGLRIKRDCFSWICQRFWLYLSLYPSSGPRGKRCCS